jgi:hypothetical protein
MSKDSDSETASSQIEGTRANGRSLRTQVLRLWYGAGYSRDTKEDMALCGYDRECAGMKVHPLRAARRALRGRRNIF